MSRRAQKSVGTGYPLRQNNLYVANYVSEHSIHLSETAVFLRVRHQSRLRRSSQLPALRENMFIAPAGSLSRRLYKSASTLGVRWRSSFTTITRSVHGLMACYRYRELGGCLRELSDPATVRYDNVETREPLTSLNNLGAEIKRRNFK